MNYLNFTKEIYKIFYKANQLSAKNTVEPKHILAGLFKTQNLISKIFDINNLPLDYKNNKKLNSKIDVINFSKESLILISNLLLKKNNINTIDMFTELVSSSNIYIKYFFKHTRILNLNLYKKFIIQSDLSYVQNLFYYIKFTKISIINRSNEIKLTLDVLDRRIKNNMILVGDTGIGRFSIIKGVFNKINYMGQNKIKTHIKEFYVFDLVKFYSIVSSDTLASHAQKIYNWILTNFELILVLNHLENINDSDLLGPIFNTIFLLVKQKKLQLLITTDIAKFSLSINSNVILLNLYESLILKELSKSSVLVILQNIVPKLENFYKIKIPHSTLPLTMTVSNLYYPNKVFPLKTIELLEITCSNFVTKYPNATSLTNLYFNKIIQDLPTIPSIAINQYSGPIKNLKFLLKKRIFGQAFIIEKINNVLIRTLSGFKAENKPIGSWLLCGPSGTGKTELAKSITEVLFGNEQKMIRFDMSEFMEKHSISKLIGSPPGYVGYGDSGSLTEAVRRQSSCLLLFDEIEKAHPDILNIMLQILDDGRLTDSTGKVVNFSNTLIIFTSNLGCPKTLLEFKKEFGTQSINYKVSEQMIMTSIKQYLRPELINRIQDILIFQPLEFKVLLLILNKFINQFIEQLKTQKFPIKLLFQENLKKYIVKLSMSPLYGARPLKRIFDELIVEPTVTILLKTTITEPHLLTYNLNNNNNISYNIMPNA